MFPIGTVARWQSPESMAIPTKLADWLLDSGSLTAKIKALHPDFAVHVLGQIEGTAEPCEYAALAMDPEPVTIREVLLYSGDTALVFARSILPHQRLAANPELTSLGDQPLGEHLFTRTDTTPGPIEIAPFSSISGAGELNRSLHHQEQDLWGRRRVFDIAGTRILVSEVFLSPSACYADSSK
ncbi:chorismate lyase [Aliidiomarina halalkaliphila]|uniref:Probable chorismate pyruvate-lyase n=1 Tax=Aliidiomarina halalkaliphila TaxID=2593535 RepID=A0A552X1T6_9GAMM|nr:chorismate lyase [Aliidiomarina halalkaliphila]TRW49011.1 chorismate lyase [Aliidiomarina halalkaliphila]